MMYSGRPRVLADDWSALSSSDFSVFGPFVPDEVVSHCLISCASSEVVVLNSSLTFGLRVCASRQRIPATLVGINNCEVFFYGNSGGATAQFCVQSIINGLWLPIGFRAGIDDLSFLAFEFTELNGDTLGGSCVLDVQQIEGHVFPKTLSHERWRR